MASASTSWRAILLAAGALAAAAAVVCADVEGDAAFNAASGALAQTMQKTRLIVRAAQAAPPSPAAEARRLVGQALQGSVVPQAFVDAAFDDPRSRLYTDIPDKFRNWGHPGFVPTYDDYRKKFIVAANINAGVEFVIEHRDVLDAVEARYGVDPALLAALVSRETYYGRFTGNYQVFDALNTIIQKVPVRSSWAVGEEAELLKMAFTESLDIHAVLGTYDAGLGFVQFEPSSFNIFAVDFDGDGKKRLDQWPDALASAANYLSRAGYDRTAAFTPASPIGRALFSYNHYDNYVRAILELRGEIAKRL